MINDTDVEVKYSLKINLVLSSLNIINALEKTSSWEKTKRIIMAVIMKYKETLLNLAEERKENTDGPTVDMNLLLKGETAVIKLCQRRGFQKKISTLEKGRAISSQSSIFKLDPFLDNDGVLRVGGRIIKANLDYHLQHHVLLPKEGHITLAIMKFVTIGIGLSIAQVLSSQSYSNVECRKLCGKICQQKIGNLPADRPLDLLLVDMFGPFFFKDG